MPFIASRFSKFGNKITSSAIFGSELVDLCKYGRGVCNVEESSNGSGGEEKKIVLPPEPQDCCMSGCANCVWIKYAEDVAKLLGNEGGEMAKAKILENVKDPNLKAFLMIELHHIFKKTKT